MERFIQASNLIATEWQDSWVFDKLTDEYEFDNNDKKAIKCAVVLYLWKEKCDVDLHDIHNLSNKKRCCFCEDL